jgi:hypothetical protein
MKDEENGSSFGRGSTVSSIGYANRTTKQATLAG